MVVGVGGKYCAGKNRVCEILNRHGFVIIDVDALGHAALDRMKEKVIEAFGPEIVGADGRIDRPRLGSIVFADRRKRERLEGILHPWMVAEVGRTLAQGTTEARRSKSPEGKPADFRRDFAVNAALLFEMGLHRLCDRVLWVRAPLPVRLLRALRRDRLSLRQILGRIWAQRKLSPQPWLKAVDTQIIRNAFGQRELESVILRVAK